MSTINTLKAKRAGQILLSIVAIALGFNFLRLVLVRHSPSSVHAASPYPYTVMRVEKVFDNTGNLKHIYHYTEASRSDGSRMWRGSTDSVDQREIFFANGDFVRTDEIHGRKSTYPQLYSGVPGQKHEHASCISQDESRLGYVLSGQETISGYRAYRIVRNGAKQTVTVWRAPDFGCAQIQFRLDHQTGITEQTLAALLPGEPDGALFRVAGSSQEVLPSILAAGCAEVTPNCKSTLPEAVNARLDKNYGEVRGKAKMR